MRRRLRYFQDSEYEMPSLCFSLRNSGQMLGSTPRRPLVPVSYKRQSYPLLDLRRRTKVFKKDGSKADLQRRQDVAGTGFKWRGAVHYKLGCGSPVQSSSVVFGALVEALENVVSPVGGVLLERYSTVLVRRGAQVTTLPFPTGDIRPTFVSDIDADQMGQARHDDRAV